MTLEDLSKERRLRRKAETLGLGTRCAPQHQSARCMPPECSKLSTAHRCCWWRVEYGTVDRPDERPGMPELNLGPARSERGRERKKSHDPVSPYLDSLSVLMISYIASSIHDNEPQKQERWRLSRSLTYGCLPRSNPDRPVLHLHMFSPFFAIPSAHQLSLRKGYGSPVAVTGSAELFAWRLVRYNTPLRESGMPML